MPTPFAFTSTKGTHSAFAFILVKPKQGSEYRIIAYLPNYDPSTLSSALLPYREMLPSNYQCFKGELREIPKFGIAPKIFENTNESATLLANPFRLRFVIPEGSQHKPHGTLVGLAEVADASDKDATKDRPFFGHIGLRVYRTDNMQLPVPKDVPISSLNLVYVATLGNLPDFPKSDPVKQSDTSGGKGSDVPKGQPNQPAQPPVPQPNTSSTKGPDVPKGQQPKTG